MNFNKDLFKTTEAKEFGEFENLELGGHELVIINAGEYTSEFSGNTSLKVIVDIAGNDKQAGYFKKQYDENTADDKKWPVGGTRYLSLKDDQLAYLKGFITALENSNPNFKFNPDGDWKQINNLKIAGQFGLEEYENQDGEVKANVKLQNFRSLDKLKDIKVPSVKLLDGTRVDYEEYRKARLNNQSVSSTEIIIDENDLPF